MEGLTPTQKELLETVREAGSLYIGVGQERLSRTARSLVTMGLLKRAHRLIGSVYTISPTRPESEA